MNQRTSPFKVCAGTGGRGQGEEGDICQPRLCFGHALLSLFEAISMGESSEQAYLLRPRRCTRTGC